MMNRRTALVAFGALFAFSGSALADIVDVRFTGTGLGRNVRTNYLGNSQNLFAGQLHHEFADGTGAAAALDGTMITFCTELTEYVTGSVREYDLTMLPLAPNSDPMGEMSAQALTDIWVYADGQQLSTENSGDNRDFAAAFQIAVWEIVHDFDGSVESLDVDDGDLTVTKTNGQPLAGGVTNYVGELFGAVGSSSSFSGLRAVTRSGAQDQVVMIPTPGSLALCAFAFVPVVGTRRRRVG